MKKAKIFFVVPLIAGLVLCAAGVSAVEIENPLSSKTFIELLDKILTFAMQLAIAVAPIMILVAGFYYITAEGDPKKIETAHAIIKWVLIGLLIVLCSKGIVDFMRNNIFN